MPRRGTLQTVQSPGTASPALLEETPPRKRRHDVFSADVSMMCLGCLVRRGDDESDETHEEMPHNDVEDREAAQTIHSSGILSCRCFSLRRRRGRHRSGRYHASSASNRLRNKPLCRARHLNTGGLEANPMYWFGPAVSGQGGNEFQTPPRR